LQGNCVSLTIGITGGIGSGKSRVCRYLAKCCRLPVIDLDLICRQLLEPGAAGWLRLKNNLDKCFFTPAGELDRTAFRTALFADNELRSRVDTLLHPLARVAMTERILSSDGSVLVEIPLLFEAGWHKDVQQIVVVYAEPAVCCQRIVDRDHVTVEQAQQAVAAQFPLSEKAKLADHVIDNSFDWQDTCLQLRRLAECLGIRCSFF
jgi:dephospho-CoA kinase